VNPSIDPLEQAINNHAEQQAGQYLRTESGYEEALTLLKRIDAMQHALGQLRERQEQLVARLEAKPTGVPEPSQVFASPFGYPR
jgi:hypothetical protein